jgi:predicted PurR-regulated permease PerM
LTSNQPPFITRAHLFALAFFAIFIFLLYQMARLLAPFSAALIWAAIITLALHPLHQRVLRLLKGRPGAASAIMTLITLLAVIGPTIAILVVFAGQAVALYQSASQGIQSGKFLELWNRISVSLADNLRMLPFLSGIDVTGLAMKGLGELSTGLAGQIGVLLNKTVVLMINLGVMLVALFFFFRDGESYYRSVMDMLPFPVDHKQSISRKVHATFTAVVNGVFLIALLQGIMTGIGFALFGIPFSIFWGLIAAVLAILPIGGAALVWIPGALFLFFTGSKIGSVLFFLWGLILVSLPDNFLKPLLIGKRTQLPAFFLFIGILGGLSVYGLLGILFGPLVVTLLYAFVQIYRVEYGEQ